mmetsp:Transcript_8775/g.17077  ORF Transcript_8775/g.17077 Transcript_8775/m.17077 type:complete len:294 (+) Transcript_8775:100-981(+)
MALPRPGGLQVMLFRQDLHGGGTQRGRMPTDMLITSAFMLLMAAVGPTDGFAFRAGSYRPTGLAPSGGLKCHHEWVGAKALPLTRPRKMQAGGAGGRIQMQTEQQQEGSGNAESRKESPVSSVNRVEELTNFGIRTFMQSTYYVGDDNLHLTLPLPKQGDYPEWVPKLLRMPGAAYSLAERGVEEGWVKRSEPDDVFEIRYGVFRARVSKERCEACDEEEARRKRNDAAESLVNIGTTERYRRASVGYALYLVATVTGILSIVSGAGPLVRFSFVCLPALLGFAFTESGRTGL